MAIFRKLPNTNPGRLQTLKKAQTKVTNAPSGGNILSAATTARLATDLLAYQTGTTAIITAIRAQRRAVKLAIPQRALLKSGCKSYIKSLDNGITQGDFEAEDRTLFGLDSGNTRLPKLTTDEEILDFSELIITGDAQRVSDGGAAMSLPTIAAFTSLRNASAPFIIAVSNAKTDLTNAKFALNLQNAEIDDCIKHVWNDAEMKYSKYAPPAKRAACRPWSVRYLSKGDISEVTGKITDSVTGLGLPGVTVKITGGKAVMTNSEGNFSITTSMYGDLELTATKLNYLDGSISFLKENGVPFVQGLELVAE